MPYKRQGRTVLVKKNGWRKKALAKTVRSAKRMIRLLRAVEFGGFKGGKS